MSPTIVMPPGIHCPAPPSSRWSNCVSLGRLGGARSCSLGAGRYDQPRIVETESVIGARTDMTRSLRDVAVDPFRTSGLDSEQFRTVHMTCRPGSGKLRLRR